MLKILGGYFLLVGILFLMFFRTYICKNCGKQLPNKKLLTEKGCEWCDKSKENK